MKAWQVTAFGEPTDVLRLADVAMPEPGEGQLAVRVLASAANFPDVLMCRGAYQLKLDPPFTPGVELAGRVTAVGSGVTRFVIGDRVIGGTAMPYGAFAEAAVMDEIDTFSAPTSLDDAGAAAFHISYQTAWFGLCRRASLVPGETLLVHAAAGGAGSAAVELGKAMGARVIAVVGSESKVDVARGLGADVVVNRATQDFVAVVKEVTGGRGADVIFDPIGGDTYQRSTKCIAFEGRILIVGFAGGEIQSAALNHALVKNYSIVGLHMGLYRRADPAAVMKAHVELAQLVDAGALHPLVSERLNLDQVPDGLRRLAEGSTVGRLVFVTK